MNDGNDNCPDVANPDQAGLDSDTNSTNANDNTPIPNSGGGACDNDAYNDSDGVHDAGDNCPNIASAGRGDADNDGGDLDAIGGHL